MSDPRSDAPTREAVRARLLAMAEAWDQIATGINLPSNMGETCRASAALMRDAAGLLRPTPDLSHIIADMQQASDAVDDAAEGSEYQARLVGLALIARHFLRERAAGGKEQP